MPNPSLPPAVNAPRQETTQRAGRVSTYVAGEGRPMVLVHSINAAGSAYEMRPLFERLRDRRRVLAPDLPGFGFSDRSVRSYDVRLFVDAVLDVIDLADELSPGVEVDLVALSLAGEFAARAATERAERIRSLTLINPTGFDRNADRLREPGATRELPGFLSVLRVGPIGKPLYRLLTRKGTIRYFLQRTYGSKQVDEDMVDYDYLTSHQPGAEHAPFAFLSGRLFSRDIRAVYESLEMPVFLPHGTKGDFKDFSGADWIRDRDNWTERAFDTGALVHYEAPDEFFAAFESFLEQLER